MKLRQAMHATEVVAVAWPQLVAGVRANRAAAVDCLRPGVSDEVGQPMTEPLRRLQAQGMVVGIDAAIDFLKPAVVLPGTPVGDAAGVGGSALQDGLIIEAKPLQFVPFIALVADFQYQVLRQLALDVEEPLVYIRRAISRDIAEKLGSPDTGPAVAGAREGLALV